jgi:dihydroxyacetone kinase
MQVPEGSEVAVLVNNLGATTPMELSIVARHTLRTLSKRNMKPTRMLVGPYMTSLDMAGVSLSILVLNPTTTAYLDAPTKAPAWGKLYDLTTASPEAAPLVSTGESKSAGSSSSGAKDDSVKEMLKRGAHALIEAESKLTEWDRYVLVCVHMSVYECVCVCHIHAYVQ